MEPCLKWNWTGSKAAGANQQSGEMTPPLGLPSTIENTLSLTFHHGVGDNGRERHLGLALRTRR